jgi:hypothetical protein
MNMFCLLSQYNRFLAIQKLILITTNKQFSKFKHFHFYLVIMMTMGLSATFRIIGFEVPEWFSKWTQPAFFITEITFSILVFVGRKHFVQHTIRVATNTAKLLQMIRITNAGPTAKRAG